MLQRALDTSATLVGWLGEQPAYVGVATAFLSGIAVFVVVGLRQNLSQKSHLRRYRFAEPYLIHIGKISIDDMVAYHRAYNWGGYASVALSTAIVVAALTIDPNAPWQEQYIIIISCSGLAIAGAILASVDIVHTNTLSPLVPVNSRFRIIDKCIIFGGLGVTLVICSVISFLSLAHPALSIIGGVTFFSIMIHLSSARALPKEEVLTHFNLDDSDWEKMNKAIASSDTSKPSTEPLPDQPNST